MEIADPGADHQEERGQRLFVLCLQPISYSIVNERFNTERRNMSYLSKQIPDEIIKEVLTPVLQVSDDAFSDTGVVILRSKAQCKALAHALSNNRLLGTFVKKLRVEGGFGISIDTIIKLAPNITDFCLALRIWSTDSVTGLCRALPRMNPQRVILWDIHSESNITNRQTKNLWGTLFNCIRTNWTSLVIRVQPRDTNRHMADSIWFATSKEFAPTLLPGERLHKLVRFEYPDEISSATLAIDSQDNTNTFNESFVLMQSTSDEIKHAIWKEKFAFQHYYRHWHHRSGSLLPLFNYFEEDPSIASHIESIITSSSRATWNGGELQIMLHPILAHATSLRSLRSSSSTHYYKLNETFVFSAIEALARAAGPTLQHLRASLVLDDATPEPTPVPVRPLRGGNTEALPALEELVLAPPDDSLLRILTWVALPVLREVAFLPEGAYVTEGAQVFLERHGPKLRKLEIMDGDWCLVPLCPALDVLVIRAQCNALVCALSGNELHGKFNSKLRIEGGFGISIEKIIKPQTSMDLAPETNTDRAILFLPRATLKEMWG
ncbi:hypothetical protein H0H81_010731 [Sphagnurus paluster]|uniref:Uncharacterized protein n=1 Tax=Sphagnurus paluster TaxID=117069 RepID=A0A9P7FQT6_9AGAR|nr:hypothetical protein H0H81_010731 [Sphagnurus paluster]